MSEHRKERQARYEFMEEEKKQMREKIPPHHIQIRGIENEIEKLKAQIKDKKTQISFLDTQNKEISKLIEDGFEFRPVSCIRFKSYKAKYWIFISEETRQEVCRESFEIGDDQRGITELIWPPDEGKTVDEVMDGILNPATAKTHFEELQEEMNRKGLNVTIESNSNRRKPPKSEPPAES